MLKYSASVAPHGGKSWTVHIRLFSVYTFNYFLIIWDYCKLSNKLLGRPNVLELVSSQLKY